MARRADESGLCIGFVKKVERLEREKNLTAENAKSTERKKGTGTRTRLRQKHYGGQARRMEKVVGSY